MTISGFLLGGNHRLECSSCHSVHNQVGSPYNIVNNPYLKIINGTKGVSAPSCAAVATTSNLGARD